jgi:hypothetical protein
MDKKSNKNTIKTKCIFQEMTVSIVMNTVLLFLSSRTLTGGKEVQALQT